jgi:hypothetical protein
MDFITPELVVTVPLTVGLVEAIKALGLPTKYAPVSAVLIGVGLACFVVSSVPAILLGGIAVGLMASGLYSGTRALVSA